MVVALACYDVDEECAGTRLVLEYRHTRSDRIAEPYDVKSAASDVGTGEYYYLARNGKPMMSTKNRKHRNIYLHLTLLLSALSVAAFAYYYASGYVTAYGDAKSHLDVGRRVVDGLSPGFGQIGTVWLPLTHILMVPSIWNDFMWHSGLSGSIQSMVSYVVVGIAILAFLRILGVGKAGQLSAVAVFALNANVLYLQSTPMTELPLLMTMTVCAYFLAVWFSNKDMNALIAGAFWVMLSTLIRYDGWFLLASAASMILLYEVISGDRKMLSGKLFLFMVLGSFGIILWILWNALIFHDPLYFLFGPFSAYQQQRLMEASGLLSTKSDILFSTRVFLEAVRLNVGTLNLVIATVGLAMLVVSRKITSSLKYAAFLLVVPFVFNVIALFFGHTLILIPGLSGDSLFNIRYGIMMMPAVAVFAGVAVGHIWKWMRIPLASVLFAGCIWGVYFEKPVSLSEPISGTQISDSTEIGKGIATAVGEKDGLVLISAYTHDASMFVSGLPMRRFVHEGVNTHYLRAIEHPDRCVRWIVMKTSYSGDSIWSAMKDNPAMSRYELIAHYSFADIYELKPEYVPELTPSSCLSSE